jgi:hypothetical protein
MCVAAAWGRLGDVVWADPDWSQEHIVTEGRHGAVQVRMRRLCHNPNVSVGILGSALKLGVPFFVHRHRVTSMAGACVRQALAEALALQGVGIC